MDMDDRSRSQRSAYSGSISSTMLAGLRTRDAEAWNRLVALFGPVVYQWCRRSGLQRSDAADLVQDVFQSVSANLENFRRDKCGNTFRGWVWTITQNKIRDHCRRAKFRPDVLGGTDANRRFQEIPETTDLAESAEAIRVDSDRLITHRAMELVRGDFEEATWQAFWRMTVDGHTSTEIADDLGMTKEAVRQAKCRVLRRLRQELDG